MFPKVVGVLNLDVQEKNAKKTQTNTTSLWFNNVFIMVT